MPPERYARSRQVAAFAAISGHADLDRAIHAATRHLFAHQASTGGLHRPCASRAIESALTLHLLRDLPAYADHAARLREFCRGFWKTANRRGPAHPLGDVDHAVSMALVAVALGVPERRPLVEAVHTRLAAFAHPSRLRKGHVFAVLLAALDPETSLAVSQRPRRAPAAVDQTWTRLLRLAVDAMGSTREPRGDATTRALDELGATQGPDGSWESHMLLTVVALLALKRRGRHPDVLDRGIRFLVREMRADGGVPFVPDVDVWLTALAGFSMARLPGAKLDLEPLAEYIARQQLASGAWAFRSGVQTADADDTGMCVSFLNCWQPMVYAWQIDRGRRALLQFRNADGGFSTYAKGAPSEAEITARAITVLAARARRHCSELDAAVRWLEAAQRPDGTYRLEWTLCPCYPIAQVLSALAVLPGDGERPRRIHDRCTQHLVASQNADGGWGAADDGRSQVLPTAYGLIGLCAARGPATDGPVLAGVEYLLAQQRADGGFDSPADALGPRPFVFEMDLFPTAYALMALASFAGARTSRLRI